MPRFVPSKDFETVLVPGAIKAAQDASGATKTDLFMVPPASIHVIEGFNLRVTGTDEYDGKIAELTQSIIENGFFRDKPLSVIVQKDDDGASYYALTDGHRRLAATLAAVAAGAEIETVPCVVVRTGTSLEDATVAMMLNGEALTPYEKAIGVNRLLKSGMDEGQIAKKLGVTKTYVTDLALILAMPAKLRTLVASGKVAAGVAVRAFRDDPKTAVDRVTEGVETAAKRGKNKAAPRDVKKSERPAGATKPGRKPNPLRTEIDFAAEQGEHVELALFEGFRNIGGGAWWTLSETEGFATIVQDVKIKVLCVLKEPTPGTEVKPVADTSDL
jgi:ParB/RepB/Spo0J family partition protein